MAVPDPPSASDWRKQSGPIKVTVDQARSNLMDTLVTEVDRVRKNVFKDLLDKNDGERPNLEELVDLFFAQDGPFYSVFKDIPAFHDYQTFRKWAGGFLLSAVTGVTYNQLTADTDSRFLWYLDSTLIQELCLPQNLYQSLWKEAETHGLPEDATNYGVMSASGVEPLWKSVQDSMNSFLTVFTRDTHGKVAITIDDDKQWFQGTKAQAGLKRVKFPNDNRNGFNLHTGALTASGLIVSMEYEQMGDSKNDYTRRLLNNIFGTVGQNSAMFLAGATVFMDRGYWDWVTAAMLVLAGAAILGTVMRQQWFPFTYDQKMREGDRREDVPLQGLRSYRRKEVQISSNGPRLTAAAHRDAKQHVTLGLTSHERQNQWELVLDDPNDAQWYHYTDIEDEENLRAKKWYKVIVPPAPPAPNDGSSDGSDAAAPYHDLMDELESLVVEPITTGANHSLWFTARAYSHTSSQSDAVINILKNTRRSELVELGFDMDGYDSVMSYLSRHPIQLEEDEVDIDVVDCQVDEILDDTDEGREHLQTLANRIRGTQSPSVSVAELRAYYAAIVETEDDALAKKSKAALEKSLLDFCGKESVAERRYCLLGKKQLAEKLRAIQGGRAAPSNTTIAQLFERLVRHENAHGPPAREDSRSRLVKRLSRCALDSAYLKRLSKKHEEYSRTGHAMETPLMKNFVRDCKDPNVNTVFDTEFVADVGIVRRHGTVSEKAQKTTIDGIGGARRAGRRRQARDRTPPTPETPFLHGIEVKSRCTALTAQRAYESGDGAPKYCVIRWNDPALRDLIESAHEAIQVLHHATVYDFEYVLLLIGDNKANVIRGIWVQFDCQIRGAYSRLLAHAFTFSLDWIYSFDSPENVAIPQEIQDLLGTLKNPMTVEDLEADIEFWRVVQTQLALPIPDIARILPYAFAIWNMYKSGSDITTQMLDMVTCIPPVDGAQAYAVARFLLIAVVVIHRLFHIGRSRTDVRDHLTVQRWKNAMSKQQTFRLCMARVSKILLETQTSVTDSSAGGASSDSQSGSSSVVQSRRTTRSQVDQVTLQLGAPSTGRTPKRYRTAEFEDKQAASIKKRREMCRGDICHRISWKVLDDRDADIHGAGGRGQCHCCKRKGAYYCLLCHEWFCFAPTKDVFRKENQVIKIDSIKDSRGNPVVLWHGCYYKKHARPDEEQLAARLFHDDSDT